MKKIKKWYSELHFATQADLIIVVGLTGFAGVAWLLLKT